MADLSRYLPLSNRASHDEGSVSSDRRAQLAEVLRLAAPLAHDQQDEQVAARSFLVEARLADDFAGTDLRGIADEVESGTRRNIAALSRGVRALLVLAGSQEVDLPPIISGSVALYGLTRAPRERRVVVAGCTVIASDAGWEFGHGPVRSAPARQILEFLLELSTAPPPLSAPR